MSSFRVNITAINPVDENRQTPPIDALVDTGAELSWIPKQILLDIGIKPRGTIDFTTATGQTAQREYGYAILRAQGHETSDAVVFAEDGDASLLGVRTLEGFGVMVDSINHQFVASTFFAPANGRAI